MSDRRLREMGIDPDGDPGEIMREVERLFRALREEADTPVIVDTAPKPCEAAGAAVALHATTTVPGGFVYQVGG